MDQELAIAVMTLDRRSDHVARPDPQRRGMSRDALEDLAMDGRVPDDATVGPALAGLELRLHERDDVAAAGERRRGGGKHLIERDEGDIDDGDIDRFRERA